MIKRINKVNQKDPIDLKNENTEEIIVSDRNRNQEMSPSVSPEKYDIEPTDNKKTFEIEAQKIKKTNYSTTNKKSKKYEYQDLELNNSNSQKSNNNSKEDSQSKVKYLSIFSSFSRKEQKTTCLRPTFKNSKITNLKKESREQRNNLTMDSNKNIHNNTILSKSIDSGTHEENAIHTFKNKEEYESA